MPGNWEAASRDVLGYVAPMTWINERYVAWKRIERKLEAGRSAWDIAVDHNGRSPYTGKCWSGTNGHGIEYDSCAYAEKVMSRL